MSKKEFISRYLLIIRRLRKKPHSTFEEILEYVKTELELNGEEEIGFSKRTLQRDLVEIRSLFNIEISFSHTEGGYYIESDESDNMNFTRMVEAYDVFQSLNQIDLLKSYFHFEQRNTLGTEYIKPIIHAIRNRQRLRFNYYKDWNETSLRTIEPLVLKEYKGRWYLFGKEKNSKSIKTFALDRIRNMYLSGETFLFPHDFDAREYFKYCFGIYRPDGNSEEPQIITFKTSLTTGKYLLSQPFHESQKLIESADRSMTFSIHAYITPDLIMEILSLGANIHVLEPDSLKNEIIRILKATLKNYTSE